MTAVTTDVGIVNLALTRLGHSDISAIDTTTKAGALAALHYDATRDAVLRMHPWNFAIRRAKLAESTKVISAITAATVAAVTTSTSHGLTTGDYVRITDVVGMTQINGEATQVTVTGATTFTCDDIDSSAFTAYSSAGTLHLNAPRFEFDYAYNLPSSPYCLKVIRTKFEAEGWQANPLTQVGQSWDDPYSYRIEGRYLLTSATEAQIEYICRATTIADYDAMFVQILALHLASRLCMPLADNVSLQQTIAQELKDIQSIAQSVDAQEGTARDIVDNTGWIMSRI